MFVLRNVLQTSSIRGGSTLLSLNVHRDISARGSKAFEYIAGMPEKPKRPRTPWIEFVTEKKNKYHEEGMNAVELARLIAKEWESTDKTRYQKEYERAREIYRQKKQIYESSLTEQQREYLGVMKEVKEEEKNIRRMRALKPPRRPRNALTLFIKEKCQNDTTKEAMKTNPPTQVLNRLGQEFKDLSDYEREIYVRKAEEDKLRFKDEFLAWYESVVSDESLPASIQMRIKAMHDRYKGLNYI